VEAAAGGGGKLFFRLRTFPPQPTTKSLPWEPGPGVVKHCCPGVLRVMASEAGKGKAKGKEVEVEGV
jgi:hypothetical protein